MQPRRGDASLTDAVLSRAVRTVRRTSSRVDIDRPGPCYSVDTIQLLRDAWGADVEIYFLVGADSLAELPTWHRPERLIRLCHVVAVERPGYRVDWSELERTLPGAVALVLHAAARWAWPAARTGCGGDARADRRILGARRAALPALRRPAVEPLSWKGSRDNSRGQRQEKCREEKKDPGG